MTNRLHETSWLRAASRLRGAWWGSMLCASLVVGACGVDGARNGECAGRADCDQDGICETDLTSADNCGACGVTCEDNAYCGASSVCNCYPGFRRLGDDCVPANEVVEPPMITRQPSDIAAPLGERASFEVEASGEDLQYEWHYLGFDGSDSGGSIGSEATLEVDVQPWTAGEYWVVVSNLGGEVESDHALLTIGPRDVCTAEELDSLLRADSGGFFRLTCDIDLANNPSGDDNINWFLPIPYFTGVLDGDGHTISNFTFADDETGYSIGLFQTLAGEVRNLNLEGFDLSGINQIGALAGQAHGDAWVHNCNARDVNIQGQDMLGGLLGATGASVFISHSSATGTIGASTTGSNVGGLVGWLDASTISHSWVDAVVTGRNSVGGLVGGNSGRRSRIVNSYTRGAVTGEDAVGGVIGGAYGMRLVTNYSVATVSGTSVNVGAIWGAAEDAIDAGSYWDIERTTQPADDDEHGLQTSVFQSGEVFAAWNEQTWLFAEGEDPILRAPIVPVIEGVAPRVLSPLGGETLTITLSNHTDQVHLHTGIEHVCDVDTLAFSNHQLTCTTLPGHLAADVRVQNMESSPSRAERIRYTFIEDIDSLFAGGSGTADDPFIVRTAAQLMALHTTSQRSNVHVMLDDDIDLRSAPTTPFGYQQDGFVLDGAGHALIGFVYTSPTSMYGDMSTERKALFTDLREQSEVRNLIARDFRVYGVQVAAFAVQAAGTLRDIAVEDGEVEADSAALLALENHGRIEGCTVTGKVTGFRSGAGLVLSTSASIIDSHAAVQLIAQEGGGLVAEVSSRADSSIDIERCSADTDHSMFGGPGGSFGGLIGSSGYMPNLRVRDCFALGSSDADSVGGLVAYVGTSPVMQSIEHCYAALSTDDVSGGVIGYTANAADITLDAVSWDTTLGPIDAVDPSVGGVSITGATGYTTEQMQTEASYDGWDFESVWQSHADAYPTLR